MKFKLTHKQRIVGRAITEPLRFFPGLRERYDARVLRRSVLPKDIADLFDSFDWVTLDGSVCQLDGICRRSFALAETTFRFP